MSVGASFILFSVFILAYIVIVEVFTVLFRLTGLTREKAKTQVISMLTNSGFTTAESEIILASKTRRKLCQLTMLFGYSFTVIIVSIIVNMFLALNQAEMHKLIIVAVSIVGLAFLLWAIMRLQIIKSTFDRFIEKLGNRFLFGEGSNAIVLIDNYGDNVMVELDLENVPTFLQHIRLADTKLKENYYIQIILIKRNGTVLSPIDGNTILQKKDIIVLFGSYKNIRTVFEHPDAL